jgi:hypothetical protein
MHNDLIEDYKKFSEWNEQFINENGGFVATEDWFNKVQESHLNLRKEIGGVRCIKTYDLKAKDLSAGLKFCEHEIETIREAIPNIDELCSGAENLLKPTITIGKRQIKTGKALSQWFEKSTNSGDLLLRSKLTKAISKLGDKWITSDESLTVMLTTTAKSFALLGHLGPDSESCFAQTVSNEEHKYILGQTPNTFILLIKEDGKNIARFWGFTNDERTVYTIANFYIKGGVQRGRIFKAVELFFADLLNINLKELHCEEDIGFVSETKFLYFNNASWSYSASKINKDQILEPVNKGILDEWLCTHCDEYESQGEGGTVDDDAVCRYCFEDANYCEYSDRHTWSYTEHARWEDKSGFVSQDLIDDVFHYCNECGVLCHNNLLVNKVCTKCINNQAIIEVTDSYQVLM